MEFQDIYLILQDPLSALEGSADRRSKSMLSSLQQALHPVPDLQWPRQWIWTITSPYASARTAYSLESHADWLAREPAPFAEVDQGKMARTAYSGLPENK